MKEKDRSISDSLSNEDGEEFEHNIPESGERFTNLLLKLHEYLPKDFPKYEPLDDEKRIYKAFTVGGVIVKMSRDGGITHKADPTLISEFKFETIVLFHFLKTRNIDQSADFEIAGLPWTFNLTRFVEKYAPKLEKTQMIDLLKVMGEKKGTIDQYISKAKKHFKLSEREQFEKNFRDYVKSNKGIYIFPFDEYLPIFGVTEDQVTRWNSEKKFTKDISIHAEERAIILLF